MEDLVKFQTERIQALETRNAYLENELRQAKDLFQDMINEWEVSAFETVPSELDEMFQNPLQQLNQLF